MIVCKIDKVGTDFRPGQDIMFRDYIRKRGVW